MIAMGAAIVTTLVFVYRLPPSWQFALLTIAPILLVQVPCSMLLDRFDKARLGDTDSHSSARVVSTVLLIVWFLIKMEGGQRHWDLWFPKTDQDDVAIFILIFFVPSEVPRAIRAWIEPDLVEVEDEKQNQQSGNVPLGKRQS